MSIACAQGINPQQELEDGSFSGGTHQAADCVRVMGSLPLAWRDNSCWNVSSRLEYEPVVSPAKEGRALKVTLKHGLFQLTQPLSLRHDAHYRLGVWLRAQTPMVVKVSLRQSGPPYADFGARSMLIGDEWTHVSVSAFSNGLWEPTMRSAMFMVSSATPGTLWVDEATLVASPHALRLPDSEVPAAYFGTHVLHGRNVRAGQADSQAGSLRVWDSNQSQWHEVQMQRPMGEHRSYRWSALDERVSLAENSRIELLMVVGGYAPAWASLPEQSQGHDGPGCHRCDQHPRRMSDWRNWVADLVGRYNGRSIQAWEVWNEPSFPAGHPWCPDPVACQAGLGSGYRGTPEQLLELQGEASSIIRRLDPTAKVVTPGVSYHHRNYLDYFLRIGGGKQVDAIGYHLYLEGPPEMSMSHVLAVRGLLQDHGLASKPLWNTESAISDIAMELDAAVQHARSHVLQAPTKGELAPAYLARLFIIGWASGLGRLYHYAWDDQHGWPSSPTRVDRQSNATISVNDTGQAFRQVQNWMSGRKLVRIETGQIDGLWRAVLKDKRGRESQLIWHPGRTKLMPYGVKAPAGATRMCSLSGQCQKLNGSLLAIDFSPVWVGDALRD